MEVPTAHPLDLNLIAEICSYLGSLIDPVYTSNGSSALILNDIGEISMTKSGMKILSEIHCHHPLAKLIVHAVENHYEKTGDGTKTFLLLLKEFIIVLKKEISNQQNPAESQLKCIRNIFSLILSFPELFSHMRSLPIANKLLFNHNENLELQFKKIAISFFATKFPCHIAEQLSNLICRFVCNSISDYTKINQTLQQLLNYFHILVSKVTSPTMQSNVIKGFIFSKSLDQSLTINCQKINFVIFFNFFANEMTNKVILKVENAKEVDEVMHFHPKYYFHIIKNFKKLKVMVVLMSELASEEFKLICKRNDIFLVDGILQDELEFLLCHTNIEPLDNFVFDINIDHVGHAKYIETIIFGSEKYLHLLLPSPQCMILQHMAVCSPIKKLGDEYYDECHNCIKVLSHFVSSDFELNLSNKKEYLEPSKIAMACPFPDWTIQLCHNLDSLAQADASTINSKITTALKNFIQNKFGSLNANSTPVLLYLEPVIYHEILLHNILCLVLQLLKIDKIINVQKNIHTLKNKSY